MSQSCATISADPTASASRSTAPNAQTDRAVAEDIGRRIVDRIGQHRYDMWFGRAHLHVSGTRVEVATDSSFVAKWIDANFAEQLRGIARDTMGGEPNIDVRVAPELFGSRQDDAMATSRHRAEATESAASTVPTSAHGRAESRATVTAPPPPPPKRPNRQRRRGPVLRRLEEFVVGPSNRLAYSTACRLLEEEISAVSPLFIHGECGLGKTHLLQGICQRYAESTGRPEHVRYVTGEQFTNEYITAVRGQSLDRFRARIRKLDLLAIDDVHFLSNKVRTQSEFLQTLNEIDLSGARVVLASDEHPRLIKKFSQALISRFLSGMVVQIDKPDRQTRLALVRRLAETRDVPMHDAAVEIVVSRCVGSVRELEGAVTKLAALRALAGQVDTGDSAGASDPGVARGEVGMVLAERLFKDQAWQPVTPVRIGTIIDVVGARLGITRPELMSSSRHRRVVLGRGLVAYLGREMTTHSYPEIARALDRSYHSTIHTAHQRLCRQRDANDVIDLGNSEPPVPLKELIDQLRHEILRATTKA